MGIRALIIFLATLVGLGFLFTSLDREVVDIGITQTIPRSPVGKVFQGQPPGQLFRCDFRDLQRIDVWVVQQGKDPIAPLFLELRRIPGDAQDKFLSHSVVRSARMEVPVDSTGPTWAVFRFDAIPDSKGSVFHLSLQPADGKPMSSWAPFLSMRSTTGIFVPWGNRWVSEPTPLDFTSEFNDLSAIAIGMDGLDAAAAETYLNLFQIPKQGGRPELIRRGELNHVGITAAGYAVFTFDPIPNSRWMDLRAEPVLPPNARVVMNESRPTAIVYHGVGQVAPEMIGQTLGKSRLPNRDLFFRAYGEDGVASNWKKLGERGAQGNFLFALLAWGAAMGLALMGVYRAV